MKAALQLRADITKQGVSHTWPPETDKSYTLTPCFSSCTHFCQETQQL